MPNDTGRPEGVSSGERGTAPDNSKAKGSGETCITTCKADIAVCIHTSYVVHTEYDGYHSAIPPTCMAGPLPVPFPGGRVPADCGAAGGRGRRLAVNRTARRGAACDAWAHAERFSRV